MASNERPEGTRPEALGVEHVELLGKVDLFHNLDHVVLAQVASHLRRAVVGADEAVCRYGEPGDSLYVIARGTFAVLVPSPDSDEEVQVATRFPGEYFGEMALLTNEPRSATVRAEGEGELLRLDRSHFLDLIQRQPSVALAIYAGLCRLVRNTSQSAAESRLLLGYAVDRTLGRLGSERRQRVLEASILSQPADAALRVMFGEHAESVARDLAALDVVPGQSCEAAVAALHDRFEQQSGARFAQLFALETADRLAGASCWEDALSVLARRGDRGTVVGMLGRAVRAIPPLEGSSTDRWIDRITDDEAARDSELALLKATVYDRRQDYSAATSLLQRALGVALLAGEARGAQRLTDMLVRLSANNSRSQLASPHSIHLPHFPPQLGARRWVAAAMGIAFLLGAIAASGVDPRLTFLLLLAMVVAFWTGNLLPASIVGLGLVVGTILLGVAKPAQALSAFASMDWLFVVAVLGLAASIARSGLLFRCGLLLVRRMPHGLFWQAGVMLLTGNILGPLLPDNLARASFTAPVALAVAQAARLKDREPAGAVLGLSTWIGAGAMGFIFLNGSQACILGWGVLPEASRQQWDWIRWFVAALPFGLLVGLGSLVALYLVLRPGPIPPPAKEGVNLQLAVLGPLSSREKVVLGVLLMTVTGWIFAQPLHLDVPTVGVLALLAASVVGVFDRQMIKELDWDFLMFFGVALTIPRVADSIGLTRDATAAIGGLLSSIGASQLVFVLAVACLAYVVRLVLLPIQVVPFLGFILVPVAPAAGVDPWVVIVTLSAAAFCWFPPPPPYLAANAASEGRLYSWGQSLRVNFAYCALILLALAVSVPYWHLLGLL